VMLRAVTSRAGVHAAQHNDACQSSTLTLTQRPTEFRAVDVIGCRGTPAPRHSHLEVMPQGAGTGVTTSSALANAATHSGVPLICRNRPPLLPVP